MQRADHGSAERLWVCSICDERRKLETVYSTNATSGAMSHLQNRHRIFPPDGPLTSSDCEDARPRKRPRISPIPKTQSTKVQELACGFIVNTDQPFGVFDDRYLRELLQQFDQDLFSQIPWSRSSQRRQLEVVFDSKKCLVQQSLREAITKIHVAFDLWTSPNRYAIVAVSGHFLDKEGRQQQRLLALTRQPGSHAGENIAHTLRRVVEDWQIEDMIGTLVSDNATNNDTCADHFFRAIEPALTQSDRVERRMRCYGHILNLVGRAFLYGEDGETFEQESQRLLDADLIEDDLRHWRHRGPVGRLRNIIKFIRASPQRSERFQTLASEADDQDAWLIHQESSRELQLILSNETRWNSTYLMIERALRKQGHLQTFLIENQMEEDASKRLPAEDVLHPEDWRLLVELKEILAPLYFQTMRCQGWGQRGSHGNVWEIMTGMEYLLDQLEDWKAYFDDPAGGAVEQYRALQLYDRSSRRKGPQATQPAPMKGAEEPSMDHLPLHTRADFMSGRADRLASLREDSKCYIRLSITNAWQKLNEYYTKLGSSPLFAAAVILHPGRSIRWLEDRWSSDEQQGWLRDAKDGLERFWTAWYRDNSAEPGAEGSLNYPAIPRRTDYSAGPRREESAYEQWLNSRTERLADESTELERYFRLELPVPIDDPIQWWMDRRLSFPTLSQLALDVFAIPAMAADCERAFSLAKLTLTSQRLSMEPSTLEKVQCLKNWVRRDAVTLGGLYFNNRGAVGEE